MRGPRARFAILKSERGTSVVELGIAAPVLLLFLAGVTDLGRGLTERYRLQQAVNRTLEMAQTGQDGDYAFLKRKPLQLRVCQKRMSCRHSGSSAEAITLKRLGAKIAEAPRSRGS